MAEEKSLYKENTQALQQGDSLNMWGIDGEMYKEWYKDPANSPPVGDEAWMSLSRKEQQDMMWDTPVLKGADAAWAETPEQRRKDMENLLEEHEHIRAWSDTKAFQEYLKKLPEGTKAYHLNNGTTIFHRPRAKEDLTS